MKGLYSRTLVMVDICAVVPFGMRVEKNICNSLGRGLRDMHALSKNQRYEAVFALYKFH